MKTASLKSVTVASEDIIHSKLSTYEELDNISRKDIRNNNKFNKIITRLGGVKLDTIIPESGNDVPSQEKNSSPPQLEPWQIAIIVLAAIALGIIIGIFVFINALFN